MPGKRTLVLTGLVIIFIIQGCQSSRRISSGNRADNSRYRTERLLNEVMENNISQEDFEIGKLRLKYKGNGNSLSFSGFLRSSANNEILLSVRTIAGIEAARILIDRDSIRINDRINRVYYHGSTVVLMKKYGVDWDEAGLIFGDLPSLLSRKGYLQCVDGRTEIIERKGGKDYYYEIDCDKRKLSTIKVSDRARNVDFKAEYREYMTIENRSYPGFIRVNLNEEIIIEIDVERFEINSEPVIRFSKGRGYDIVQLR